MANILLVDDSTTILASMSGVLEKAGHRVDTAPNAEAAMAKLRGGASFKLIITDYHMPGMNGVEFIRAARQEKSCRFTPMLVLTTESQQDKRQEARSAGATGWLVKPVPPDQLLAVVGKVIPGA